MVTSSLALTRMEDRMATVRSTTKTPSREAGEASSNKHSTMENSGRVSVTEKVK